MCVAYTNHPLKSFSQFRCRGEQYSSAIAGKCYFPLHFELIRTFAIGYWPHRHSDPLVLARGKLRGGIPYFNALLKRGIPFDRLKAGSRQGSG